MEQLRKIQAGDVRTASRLIRNLEDELPEAKNAIRRIFPHTGRAHVVGITGSPGAGKSTLVDALIASFRKQEKTVGVLAVDPTSPFTGGAILGDRIRMQRHAEDPGVFVRSLATRGALGGLSKAVGDAVHVMDVMGKDLVLVETVGTGQQEVEIINHSHTVIVVLVPGMGDEIQAIKAGIMEIADIFVINKADRDGSHQLESEIMSMLNMVSEFQGGWRPPIVRIGNCFEPGPFGESLEELAAVIGDHYRRLVETDLLGDRMKRKTMVEIHEALRDAILAPILKEMTESGEMGEIAGRLLRKETDPYTIAEEVARRRLK
ncbi:MAG: methylmalonyl Co-A mutase-associated GTPase MeaB [Proteobacteria bacterium]|nr:methylmalonyl Co-A mutase-associated GTPase MeaB [Pseudomonadota bacterium]MBU1966568.1 methylmalonyl Co-A mutase-associated GTPase MeaB [Pseudomonadota bacterium]